jgi:hypothetical protein
MASSEEIIILDIFDYWSLPICDITCKLSAVDERGKYNPSETVTAIQSSNIVYIPHEYVCAICLLDLI